MTQEEEIMGGSDKAGSKKSEIMGKNLDQMVNVLRTRLKSLEDASHDRIRLCQEDLNAKSKNMSKQAIQVPFQLLLILKIHHYI